jgi:hypothetical protein
MCNTKLAIFLSQITWTMLAAYGLNTAVKAQTLHNNPHKIEIVYGTKVPLTIAVVNQYPLKGFDINLIPESNRDSFIYNPVISEDTHKLNKEAAIREKKALAVGGEYLALVCTNKTSCHLKRNTVLARKERVGIGHDGIGSVGYDGMAYPDHTEDGVTIQVKHPLQNTLLLLRGNLPSLKKDHSIKTWYANINALKAREKKFNNYDNYVDDATENTVIKKQYRKTVVLDDKQQLIIIGKPKKTKYASTNINWFIKLNNIEKKLTLMEGGTLDLERMADVSNYLLWVGDLDGDNQPDLIINNDGGWGEIEYKLFLSTDIKPNTPWKPAAIFDMWLLGPTC